MRMNIKIDLDISNLWLSMKDNSAAENSSNERDVVEVLCSPNNSCHAADAAYILNSKHKVSIQHE